MDMYSLCLIDQAFILYEQVEKIFRENKMFYDKKAMEPSCIALGIYYQDKLYNKSNAYASAKQVMLDYSKHVADSDAIKKEAAKRDFIHEIELAEKGVVADFTICNSSDAGSIANNPLYRITVWLIHSSRGLKARYYDAITTMEVSISVTCFIEAVKNTDYKNYVCKKLKPLEYYNVCKSMEHQGNHDRKRKIQIAFLIRS